MKLSKISKIQSRALWGLVILLSCSAIGYGLFAMTHKSNEVITSQPSTNYSSVVNFETDHKTYGTAAELIEESDTVILGTVLNDGETKEEPMAGISGDGKPAPSIATTEFNIQINNVLKGKVINNSTIKVVLTGGVINDVKYASNGMPWLSKGDSVIFYLSNGADDKFYPLAGGAALAISTSTDSNKYILPPAASSNGKQIVVSKNGL